MTITLLITTLLFVGWKFGRTDTHDYKASWQYARQYAKRYRQQRDDLQARLTRRVLENRQLHRQLHAVRDRMTHRSDVLEAIRLASVAYSVDYGLLVRIARCESWLDPNAKNRHSTASGLFQFLTGTFAGTPYGRESIWSPYASSLAAAWMISRGRRNEWIC